MTYSKFVFPLLDLNGQNTTEPSVLVEAIYPSPLNVCGQKFTVTIILA